MYDPTDPRSWDYHRDYVRPPLNVFRVLCKAALYCGILAFTYFLFHQMRLCVILVFIILFLKRKGIAVWGVKCYQHFAPIRIRCMCRFEPSCSQYMILAIEKYGVMRGVHKGINRIVRCASGDGGFDYP